MRRTTALFVLTLPLRGVRALYWAIDTDAKVRSLGAQTVGRVEKTRTDTQVHTDPETGAKSTTYTHYVSYSFPDGGGETRRDEKKVGSLGDDESITLRPRGLPAKGHLGWGITVSDEVTVDGRNQIVSRFLLLQKDSSRVAVLPITAREVACRHTPREHAVAFGGENMLSIL